MSKMTLSRRLFLFGSSCLALLAGAPRVTPAQTRARVTFVLVNDIYHMSEQPAADGAPHGGFARLAAVVNAERRKGPVIFAHAGDTLSPSLLSGIDRGAHIVALTNLIAPDIFVPGNHEFDFGKDVFFQRMAEARFPLFTANIQNADGTPVAGLRHRAMVNIGGINIGLTGATDEDAAILSSVGDLTFPPAVEAVEAQAAVLRKEGADIVVAVVHTDRAKDELLLRNGKVDIILSGHDHDLWLNYDGRNLAAESSTEAFFVTCIDVTFTLRDNEGRREVVWQPQIRIVDTRAVTPDPAVLAAVARYEEQLSQQLDVAIATTAVELDSRNASVRSQETAIGNLFADAMRAGSGADIAVMNGGGLRGNRVYRPGSALTRRDVMAELAFGNQVAVLEISGRAIREGLENGLSRLPRPAGRFPQVSGLAIVVEPARPAGQRILSVRVNGAPLDERKTYRLATNDFLARGGDGYDSFNNVRELTPGHDGPLLANEVIAYLEKIGTVRSAPEGRIVFK